MDVTVVNRQRHSRVSAKGLASFARRLARWLPPGAADRMAICLVSDRAMEAYNRDYRGKKGSTDVLAFEGGRSPDPEGGRHLGDILIAIPTAARQARGQGHSLAREIRVLLMHGYLHLIGYDHEADDGEMMALQRRLEARMLRRSPRRSR